MIQGEKQQPCAKRQDCRHRPGPVEDAVDRKSREQQHGEANDPQIYHSETAGSWLRADHRVLDQPRRAEDPKTEKVIDPVLPYLVIKGCLVALWLLCRSWESNIAGMRRALARPSADTQRLEEMRANLNRR
jgi:hypothetical protein